ncbi:ABC transporter permease [Alkalihalobacillus alcalophilus ATCC 27647 = CGMCC 1.3604]|uniref:Transport permease protein n=1 Tax=Alkalihalobacillus alcalophilus ATCC 27647 = CGMCC 1.3604 TaxID=1218173 RepID=J8TFA6_ALKAL|nr:ABC transporter permease [Alkalihalobacillus alcalophilus]AFV25962.1 multidrug transporter [Alkalihalobacillus alcalophilus ATCC 27647 = CGMCC 1.3604]KGA98156.1 ABC transporter permease [Alkalihalobacillus alcalophilus ATCC 27647 = CGMCC 1.3604]MED1560851.1 ABC transporter permease [Alkalihalobacillus alcalophilus]THG91936.1 ABC transporter permease [Alkalihalobacillus alcalophilus ATCC 27647 = CGMCC 1.3604]
MWAVAQMEAKKQFQDKSLVFWTLILPFIFIVGFMFIFGNNAPDREQVVNQIITGFSVFFPIFIIISIVISFVKDREKGLVARLASTPLSVPGYFVGKLLPFVVIVFLQVVVLSLIGIFIYGLTIAQPFLYFLIALCLAFMVTSWGIGISVFSKTENTGLVITQIIAFAAAILGGLWMPFEILPEAVQTVGKFLPQYWTHQSLISAVTVGPSSVSLGMTFLLIFIYTIIGMTVALAGYKRFLSQSKN